MKNFFIKLITDNHGQLSHARFIALMVGASAVAIIWKITIMGQLNETYFLYFLAYGTIHQSLNKSLDVIGAWLGIKKTEVKE